MGLLPTTQLLHEEKAGFCPPSGTVRSARPSASHQEVVRENVFARQFTVSLFFALSVTSTLLFCYLQREMRAWYA